MVRENGLDEELEKPLARWINQRENYIVGADVGPRAPEWMEGPVANEPGGFPYLPKRKYPGTWRGTSIVCPPVVDVILGIQALGSRWWYPLGETNEHFCPLHGREWEWRDACGE